MMRTTSAARDAAAGKLAETQARLANLETRSRDTEIAQAKADLADLVADARPDRQGPRAQ